MSCCDGIIKYLLFIFNIVFSISGLALIVAGSVLIYKASGYGDVLSEIKSGYLAPQIVLIVLGVIVFITATLGCCGAIQGNRCKLITYAIFLIVILVVELAIGIYAAVNLDDLKEIVVKGMKSYFDKMFSSPDRERVFHEMEKVLECCGVSGSLDYTLKLKPIPQSCCRSSACDTVTGPYWPSGCATAVTDLSTTAGKVVAGLGIALALLEIVGAAFALRLASLLERVY